MKDSILKMYYVVIPLLIIGIPFRYTSFSITLLLLIPLLLLKHRHTVGFFLVMYSGSIGGIVRTIYPEIPVYGRLLGLIGFILMWDLMVDFLKNHIYSLFVLLATLVVFGCFYILGPQDAFSNNKFTNMCIHASLMLLGYYTLNKSNKIDAEGLVQLLFMGSLCMYAFIISYYHHIPGSFFDYDWFREQTLSAYYAQGGENFIIGYQHVGLTALYGIALYLSKTQFKPALVVFYLTCGAQLILMSGCRQAMLALFFISVFRYLVFKPQNIGSKNLGKIVKILVGFVAAYLVFILIVNNMTSDVITKTLQEGDSGRERVMAQAWSIFQSHTLFGAGIGGFHAITREVWPHNFFLELLCECGIIGTALLIFIMIFNLAIKHVGLLHTTNSNMFFFLILLALFIRIMVSADLSESIELFSAVFAISGGKRIYYKTKNA